MLVLLYIFTTRVSLVEVKIINESPISGKVEVRGAADMGYVDQKDDMINDRINELISRMEKLEVEIARLKHGKFASL